MNNLNQQINISLDQTTEVVCHQCGCKEFTQALRLRVAPGLLIGQDKPSYLPIPVFACNKCGHVNTEFLPKEMKMFEE